MGEGGREEMGKAKIHTVDQTVLVNSLELTCKGVHSIKRTFLGTCRMRQVHKELVLKAQ